MLTTIVFVAGFFCFGWLFAGIVAQSRDVRTPFDRSA